MRFDDDVVDAATSETVRLLMGAPNDDGAPI
jgi:hypothetical protein